MVQFPAFLFVKKKQILPIFVMQNNLSLVYNDSEQDFGYGSLFIRSHISSYNLCNSLGQSPSSEDIAKDIWLLTLLIL